MTVFLPRFVSTTGNNNSKPRLNCDFQKTETKYVSGEEKKRNVLIRFTAQS